MFDSQNALPQSNFTSTLANLPCLKIGQPEYEAVIEDVVEPGRQWRVRYEASFWKARSVQTGMQFLPKQIVRVVGRQNLTLIIQAL